MKKIFAGCPKEQSPSLIEALYAKGLLGEDEDLTIEQAIEYCAEDIAGMDDDKGWPRRDDPDQYQIGDDWEFEGWTIEWEGTATFWKYYEQDTNSGECIMDGITIARAEAWQGESSEEAIDVKDKLEAALKPYLEKNRAEISKYSRYR